jgi:hypothetical protein
VAGPAGPAAPEHLRERIRLRGLGGGPPIAGDELRGQPAAVLDRAYGAAVAQAAEQERSGVGDVRVDTDGRTVDDLAREIAGRSGLAAPSRYRGSRFGGGGSA